MTVIGESTTLSAPPAPANDVAFGPPLPQRSSRRRRARRARKSIRQEEAGPPQRLARRRSGLNLDKLRPHKPRISDPIRAV